MSKERKRSKSFILYFLETFTSLFYSKVSCGFFGNLTKGCLSENKLVANSFANSLLGVDSKFGRFARKMRFIVAEQFEDSFMLKLWKKLILFLAGCKLRLYGSFLMTFGVYVGLVYAIKPFIDSTQGHDSSYLIWAIGLICVSLPLLFTGKTLASSLTSSTFGFFLASEVFGISEEKLSIPSVKNGDNYSAAIFVGIVAGTFSYFFSPMYIPVIIVLFIGIALIMTSPEIGVVCAFALLPLFSSTYGKEILVAVILLYSFSYFIKLLRGKRILRFGFIDLLTLMLCFVIVLSGAFNPWNTDGALTLRTVVLIVGCFIAGNLMSTKIWQKRCVFALICSGFASAVFVIWQRVASAFSSFIGLPLDELFSNGERIVENRDSLAVFISFTLVLSMALIYKGEGIKHRFAVSLMAGIMGFALILTPSLAAWIGCTIALVIFFLTVSRKTITVGAFAVVIVPSLLLILGADAIRAVLDFFGINLPSLLFEVKIWRGSFELFKDSYFMGLGVGGFEELYPIYASAGFENATHPGTVWLSLLLETGIIGLLLVVAILAFTFKNSFAFIKENVKKSKKAFVSASSCALLGMTVQGLFCNFWNQPALLYLYFVSIYVITTSIRSACAELDKQKIESANTEYAASVEI